MNEAEEVVDPRYIEGLLRITAEYVAEVQAGHTPHLGDYMARYPEYADAIAEFVAYYHAVEIDLPGESPAMPQLSERSSTAMERAWERIQASSSDGQPAGPLTTLLSLASKRNLSLAELAVKAGLSQDIIEELVRRGIAPSTLPRELLRRFAVLLQQPFSVVAACFGLSGQWRPGVPANGAVFPAGARLAEARPSYTVEESSGVQVQSFRKAIEQSEQLSDKQKAMWSDILSREGL